MADYYLEQALMDEDFYRDDDPPSVTCRCCGKKGLQWKLVEGKWRLFNKVHIHKCKVNPLKETT